MCFGGGDGPKYETQGPDPMQVAEQQRQMQQYQDQMRQQQEMFQQQLNAQIQAANQQAEQLKIQLAEEQAALEADQAAQFAGAYNTNVAQVSQGEGAQSTKKKEPKKDTGRKSLKVNVAGVQNTSGTGINLGV